MTQMGLGGALPRGATSKGPARAVMDDSYFLGVLRAKMGELTTETAKLRDETAKLEREATAYQSYESKAEVRAGPGGIWVGAF